MAPTYNKLSVKKPTQGGNEYLVTFGTKGTTPRPERFYVDPTSENFDFMYIVKGSATFNVVAFKPEGIQIRVVGTTPESFMIEISLFGTF